LREEEIKWFQRAKTKNLLQGDNNTKYFQLVANGKRCKTRIFHLEQGEGIIEGDENQKKYITKYYKGLFGHLERNNFSRVESMRENISQVTEEENEALSSAFLEKDEGGGLSNETQ
jgi:hypothetical protein